ncbi:MAG: hypothetical protein RL148_325 [Planctomycetota bacterium]
MRVVALTAAMAAVVLAPEACAQSSPGTTRWGANHYVEYVVGNLPVLVSAPHGGDLEPATIPDRTFGTTVKDTRTIELTREFSDRLAQRFGLRPHMVICHLARTKLDANREIVEAAQGNPVAEQAWNDFHQSCADARQAILAQWGFGIYIDLHGHGHPEGWVELGYALSSTQLNLPNSTLNSPTYVNQSTIRSAASVPGIVFTDLLRGNLSLGAALEQGAYASVPSPTNPGPGTGNYFSGGFNTVRYGSLDGLPVDGLQIESPWSVRSSVSVRTPFLDRVGGWIEQFFSNVRGAQPAAGNRIVVEAADRVASERGGRAEFVVRRTGGFATSRLVALQFVGSATAGVDYTTSSPFAFFPVGASEARIAVTALDDALVEGTETVEVRLPNGTDTGVPSVAEVVLQDDEPSADLALSLAFESIAGGALADASGNNRNASALPTGSGPTLVAGVVGNAIRFDGVDDRARLADFPYAPAGEFTVSFWFRAANTTATGFRYLVSHGGTSTTNRLGIYFDQTDGRLRTALVYANNLTELDVLDVTRDLRDGQWHHYALVAHTDDLCRVYVDGVPETAAMYLGTTVNPATDFVLGARSDLGAGTQFQGEMDEFTLWDRALSAVEVRLLREGLGRDALVYPGTGPELQLATGLALPQTRGPGYDVKLAQGGQLLTASYGTATPGLYGSVAALVADVFVTGAPPSHPSFPGVWLANNPVVVNGPVLLGPGAGGSWSWSVPAGAAGLSLMLQPIALWSASANGVFTAGDAHEIRLR